ncbi:MAG TPA: helix-turn-helix domain-containing protein [Candidatus Nanoarchaeia archaeon]|nr:helix-turn-helix domain-containing protein [Candidatus Nanoarchaeia archaeon]
MEFEQLQKAGLNRAEARIYFILLGLGQARAGTISKKTQINRTTTYDVLERLLEKGLVTYAIEANRKIFKPAAPRKIVENIREQERAVQKMLPALEQIYAETKEEDSVVFKGKKGIRSIMQDILTYKEYFSFGSMGEFLEVMQHDFRWFQERKCEKKILSLVLMPEHLRDKEIVTSARARFRFIPDAYATPSTTWIYGDKVAIIMWSDTPLATVITSRKIAQSYRSYFKLIWRAAKN